MEEMHMARYGKGTQSFHDFSKGATCQDLHVFITLEALQTLPFWGFKEASFHGHD